MTRKEYIALLKFKILVDDIHIRDGVEWLAIDMDGEFWSFLYKPTIYDKMWGKGDDIMGDLLSRGVFEFVDANSRVEFEIEKLFCAFDGMDWTKSLVSIKEIYS